MKETEGETADLRIPWRMKHLDYLLLPIQKRIETPDPIKTCLLELRIDKQSRIYFEHSPSHFAGHDRRLSLGFIMTPSFKFHVPPVRITAYSLYITRWTFDFQPGHTRELFSTIYP
jgi:hypothetical protein